MNLVSDTANRVRWAIGLNGALSVAFGAMILIWPGIGLYALTILFGAYSLANGVISLVNAANVTQGRGWIALSGVLGIGVGLAVLTWPSISALSLLYVIAAYAIGFGVMAIGRVLASDHGRRRRAAVPERAGLDPVRRRHVRQAGRRRARPAGIDRRLLAGEGHHRAGRRNRREPHHEARVQHPDRGARRSSPERAGIYVPPHDGAYDAKLRQQPSHSRHGSRDRRRGRVDVRPCQADRAGAHARSARRGRPSRSRGARARPVSLSLWRCSWLPRCHGRPPPSSAAACHAASPSQASSWPRWSWWWAWCGSSCRRW